MALLKVLKLNLSKVTKFYRKYEATEGRGKIHKINRYKKNFKLIDESYNANPISVKNAIINLNSIKKQKFKKYLILGDMLELGTKSEKLHKNLSRVINNSDIEVLPGLKLLLPTKHQQKRKYFMQDEDEILL